MSVTVANTWILLIFGERGFNHDKAVSLYLDLEAARRRNFLSDKFFVILPKPKPN